ncbi:hypothetical protein D3C75_642480 [compost metagenome]
MGRSIERFYRIGPARTIHYGSSAQQRRDTLTVKCSRHDQNPQILTQHGLRLKCQGKPQIGMETTLMKFIKDDKPDIPK